MQEVESENLRMTIKKPYEKRKRIVPHFSLNVAESNVGAKSSSSASNEIGAQVTPASNTQKLCADSAKNLDHTQQLIQLMDQKNFVNAQHRMREDREREKDLRMKRESQEKRKRMVPHLSLNLGNSNIGAKSSGSNDIGAQNKLNTETSIKYSEKLCADVTELVNQMEIKDLIQEMKKSKAKLERLAQQEVWDTRTYWENFEID